MAPIVRLLHALPLALWIAGAPPGLPVWPAAGGHTLHLPLVARFSYVEVVVGHGEALTRAHVGPAAIGITAFGVVHAGGEIRDGETYPFVQEVNGPATYNGYTITTPHLLIDGQHIDGGLDFYTTRSVVIRGSLIRPHEGGYWAVHFRGQQALVLYSSIGAATTEGAPDDPTHQISDAISGETHDSIFVRNLFSMACNMFELGGSNIQIVENLMEDFVYYTDAHLDGVQVGGGDSGYRILRNKIVLNADQTGAISLFQDWGVNTDFVIDSNYLAGGGYTFYGGAGAFGHSTGIIFTNNVFGRDIWPESGYWGPVAYWDGAGAGNVWANNRFADGEPLPEP
ncbi:MAG: hypothetical protein JNL73_22480 [Anaerolineales bacterium]|nr:hypothetical protein [Anaerolineales bacterium]